MVPPPPQKRSRPSHQRPSSQQHHSHRPRLDRYEPESRAVSGSSPLDAVPIANHPLAYVAPPYPLPPYVAPPSHQHGHFVRPPPPHVLDLLNAFDRTLRDGLTFNSKPIINHLTMMATDAVPRGCARDVVDILLRHFSHVLYFLVSHYRLPSQ